MIREAAEGVTLSVRVHPGAKKTAITGIYGEGATAQLKIAVHAPPIEGRANAAVIAFLAETFVDEAGSIAHLLLFRENTPSAEGVIALPSRLALPPDWETGST